MNTFFTLGYILKSNIVIANICEDLPGKDHTTIPGTSLGALLFALRDGTYDPYTVTETGSYKAL